jgi:hypothetical protein
LLSLSGRDGRLLLVAIKSLIRVVLRSLVAILRLATRFIPIQWLEPIPILRLSLIPILGFVMSLIPILRLGLSLIPILRLGWLVPILWLVLLAAVIAVLTHA